MTKGKQLELQLTRVKGRRVRVDFKGGEVTSNAGLLLIREVDRRLGLTEQAAQPLQEQAKQWFEYSGKKQRLFQHFEYGAKSWRRRRLIIHKAEHTTRGSNPRFVVTNLPGNPQELYDKVYCGRGEMENRIKEQMQLFSERTSAHQWWANQWRLLLSALAYTLMEAMRRFALKGTKWARLQCHSLRLKLIKIGAVIVRNTRTIHFHLSESYPWASLFNHAARRLAPT